MILSNCKIILENEIIEKGIIRIENGLIKEVYPTSKIEGIDLGGNIVFPGFIDTHIHGANGRDFMDFNDDLNDILSYTVKEGVTSLLATTMTQSIDNIKKALSNIALTKSNGTKILGIHLEGPFLSSKHSGAQSKVHFIQGTEELMNDLQSEANGLIKVVTIAPETQTDTFVNHLIKEGYTLSMGHTNVSHDEVTKYIDKGINRITHCFNAMSKFHHRDIGLVGSALLYDDLTPEIIPDFIHSSKQAVELLYKNKKDNMIIITDAMRAKSLPDGKYDLGGQTVTVKNNRAMIKDTLAGSIVTYDQAVKNVFNVTNCTLNEIAKMTSGNSAKELKLNQLGYIKEGYIADLTIVNENLDITYTIIDGKIKYKRG